MTEQNTRLGIWLMILTTAVFSVQDGISRHLAGEYNVLMVVMIRYWFFAAFVIAIAKRQVGSVRAALYTRQPLVQGFRSALLALEICTLVAGFTLMGIIDSQAIFIAYPLLIAALSGPILGERVGWRRWLAIGVGFIGVLIIIRPGFGVFSPAALLPLVSALMFAVYGLLNRYVARQDSAVTTFYWNGTVGCVVMSVIGIWFWEPMTAPDWAWMLLLCCVGMLGHYLLIRVYAIAEASAVQPFAYLQLFFGSLVGIYIFGETLQPNVIVGAAVVIGAGLFTLWRERHQR